MPPVCTSMDASTPLAGPEWVNLVKVFLLHDRCSIVWSARSSATAQFVVRRLTRRSCMVGTLRDIAGFHESQTANGAGGAL